MQFFSPGKLLLTSEYFVLDGALALAVPVKYGQKMTVEEFSDGKNFIYWKAFHEGEFWLECSINRNNWEVISTNNIDASNFVKDILRGISERAPSVFQEDLSYSFQTNLQFPSNFGLGSSSTLLVNLANWSGTDPFELNETFLKGSGYDIAVALEKSSILFRNKPEIQIEKINFNPCYKSDLVFIHLNKKQDSRKGISLYRSKPKPDQLIEQISGLTKNIIAAATISEFSELITEHEQKVSQFLGLPTVKELFFKDYPGALKSLGAWGGDFILAEKTEGWQQYFEAKNFKVYFEWQELIVS